MNTNGYICLFLGIVNKPRPQYLQLPILSVGILREHIAEHFRMGTAGGCDILAGDYMPIISNYETADPVCIARRNIFAQRFQPFDALCFDLTCVQIWIDERARSVICST